MAAALEVCRSIESAYDLGMETPEPTSRSRQYTEITSAILRCSFAVAAELGAGFLESVYERAMVLALHEEGCRVQRQAPIAVLFRGQRVGDFCADLLVEECVLVELKAVKSLLPEHHAQIINYLKATGIEVGLLINFGNPKIEYRRFSRTREGPPRAAHEPGHIR